MPRRLMLLLTLSLLLPQSVTPNQNNQSAHYEDADAYAVYSAILPTEWPVRVAQAKSLVIYAETRAYEMCLRPEKEWQKVMGPAISDYVKVNKKTWLLQSKFAVGMPCKIINSDGLKAARIEGFYKLYPDSGGWIELSAVGFNPSRTIAVVYMGHSCGNNCGGGTFHVLQKKEGRWIPLDWNGTKCGWNS